jgi:hypothetical protein
MLKIGNGNFIVFQGSLFLSDDDEEEEEEEEEDDDDDDVRCFRHCLQ